MRETEQVQVCKNQKIKKQSSYGEIRARHQNANKGTKITKTETTKKLERKPVGKGNL